MLGHASAAMTLDVYAGLFGDDLDAVANSLDAAARRSSADILRTTPAQAPVVPLRSKQAKPARPGLIVRWGGRGLNPRPEDYESGLQSILWHLQAA